MQISVATAGYEPSQRFVRAIEQDGTQIAVIHLTQTLAQAVAVRGGRAGERSSADELPPSRTSAMQASAGRNAQVVTDRNWVSSRRFADLLVGLFARHRKQAQPGSLGEGR